MTQLPNQDINLDEVLKTMCTVEGATQYLVLNAEGIPIKKSNSISAERALQISFLVLDYWSTAKKVVQMDLRMHDNPVQKIRIRTSKQQQIIIIQSYHGQATLFLIQDCNRKEPEVVAQKVQIKQQ